VTGPALSLYEERRRPADRRPGRSSEVRVSRGLGWALTIEGVIYAVALGWGLTYALRVTR
jgi:hypothetical protein